MRKLVSKIYVLIFIFSIVPLGAQIQPSIQEAKKVAPTSASLRLAGFEKRKALQDKSLLKNMPFRSIGPAIMSGRAVDIDANPSDPSQFYVAYASGGLWKTENNGQSFESLFDNEAVMTIGDIAVDWNHGEIIWLGTGENNSSRSSYSGTGIYKSEDQGKTWRHKGLPESHHIGRIIIHPEDPNTVWIAALGHLYSANPERGIYKTNDGGTTWKHTLFVDENSGAIDLVIDPENPDILYAAIWERTRRAWNMTESGPHSGIYKSIDGGKTWQLLTTTESGFPTGDGVGRIGLALYSPNILYAFLDNQYRREQEKEYALSKDMLQEMSKQDFLNLDEDDINNFLDRYNFPMEFHADTLFQLIKKDVIKPITLIEFLEDANSLLFDTPVIGGEIYRSDDSGKSWRKTNEGYLDNLVYSFGYYFGEVRISHQNPDHIYILAVPLIKSEDGGKTFISIMGDNVHVDVHSLWLNPAKPGHLISGNDGGINISYDDGQTWFKANSPAVGQFYTVAVDMAEPYNVYGGLQDNGVWKGPSTYKASLRWTSNGHYPFRGIMGGDGMQIAIDLRDNKTVYTGYQFGNYYRVNMETGKQDRITPKHKLGQRPFRFNWQTPIRLSKHNQDILYLGSQKLHRSMDQGRSWEAISGDLTQGGKPGDVPYGTLTTIHESPLKFGLIYTGSDDGLIHITKDGGSRWQRISDSLPRNLWVSRVQASTHDEKVVYAGLNGYRWDNFETFVYKSTDYGQNWRRIGLDIPAEPVNVIKEDPVNPQIIYVGTDHGLYVSINGGKTFMGMNNNLPDAPVHDLVIHPRDKELIVATHGRSIYLANVQHLQEMNAEFLQKPLHMFKPKEIKFNKNWGNRTYNWKFRNSPDLEIVYYSAKSGQAEIHILGEKDFLLHAIKDTCDAGLNYINYDLSLNENRLKEYLESTDKEESEINKLKAADNNKFYLQPGEYSVEIQSGKHKAHRAFKIKEKEKKSRKKSKKTP